MVLSSRPCIPTMLTFLMLLQLAFKVSLQEGPNRGDPIEGLEHFKMKIKELQNRMTQLEKRTMNSFKVLLGYSGAFVGDKIFKRENNRGSFQGGINTCDEELVLPKNAEENETLKKLLEQRNERAILAISYNQTQNIFLDVNGHPLQYSNWASGQPQILEDQECVIMVTEGEWKIDYCDEKWPLYCEFSI